MNFQWREERERRRAGNTDDGKKGKKDRGKSPKGKAGKKTPEPAVPKNESKLQKRGEEDLDSKYIGKLEPFFFHNKDYFFPQR